MTRRSEAIVLVLWVAAIVVWCLGCVACWLNGFDMAMQTQGAVQGCYFLLMAILVAVIGRE